MRILLIGCEVLIRELCDAIVRSPHVVDARFLTKGLHDRGARVMREGVQAAIDERTVLDAFRAQAEALAEGGADALLFETFSDVDEARLAVRAAQPLGLPILVSFAFDSGRQKDRTMMGVTPETAARAMADEGVDAVGANCGAGPEFFPAICRRLKESSGLPVWVKPNAGLPALSDGRAVYTMGPESFSSYLPALIAAGASFVGGCCGTSPDFIRALVEVAGTCESC